MKKTFLATRNTFLSSAKVSWGTFALTGALATLLLRFLAPNIFWYMFTPLFHTADTLAAESHVFFSSFGDTARLAAQNEQLVKENAALARENSIRVQKETALVALLASPFTERSGMRGIPADVVARPPMSPYDTLVLAAGSQNGVTLGQEAFGAGGIPLGVVSSVLANFSRVTLFSAPGIATQGWVGRSSITLTILGEGGGAVSANVPRSAGVLVGDIVFVPGPGRLPFGTVVRIDGDSSSPSVTLRIQSALNLFSETLVLLRDTGVALLSPAALTPP